MVQQLDIDEACGGEDFGGEMQVVRRWARIT
jgi:hypothetical protein